MKVLYFTSTGNNLFIAKKLGGELYSIPRLLQEGNLDFEDDAIGIIYPCHFLGTPRIVKEFLEKVKLRSKYIFAIMSYGKTPAGGISHFLKIAQRAGIKVSYFNEICMVDNYLPMFDMEQQIKISPLKNIEANLANIISDIRSNKIFIKSNNAKESALTFLLQLYYKINIRNADARFFIEDSCNSCGICEKVCPVANITVNKKPVYLHHCEECLACAHHCPQQAIKIKNEKGKARYRNEHISLQEIINAHYPAKKEMALSHDITNRDKGDNSLGK